MGVVIHVDLRPKDGVITNNPLGQWQAAMSEIFSFNVGVTCAMMGIKPPGRPTADVVELKDHFPKRR